MPSEQKGAYGGDLAFVQEPRGTSVTAASPGRDLGVRRASFAAQLAETLESPSIAKPMNKGAEVGHIRRTGWMASTTIGGILTFVGATIFWSPVPDCTATGCLDPYVYHLAGFYLAAVGLGLLIAGIVALSTSGTRGHLAPMGDH